MALKRLLTTSIPAQVVPFCTPDSEINKRSAGKRQNALGLGWAPNRRMFFKKYNYYSSAYVPYFEAIELPKFFYCLDLYINVNM